MTDYMPYEQCNRCKLDHCCWSNGSFIWEDGNTPNSCKEFMPEDERMDGPQCANCDYRLVRETDPSARLICQLCDQWDGGEEE